MLLAFQVPQGNLKLLDAHPELSPSETRDRLHASLGDPRTMVTVSSSSRMRVVLCWGPSARAFILALALGHLRLAEAFPMVARPSSSYARGVLPRVVNFKGGNGSSSHFSKLVAVDAYEILDIGGPPYGGYELALLDPLPSFARVLVPRVPGPFNQSTGMLYSTIFGGVISPASVMKFIDDVVFATVRMRESFRVAHELLICYFREMDYDPARQMHMGNVFRRGGQDTLLSEARRNAAAFFRAGGGILQPKGITADKVGDIKINKDIKPNGKDDPDNKKPCPDFNGGRPCKKLIRSVGEVDLDALDGCTS